MGTLTAVGGHEQSSTDGGGSTDQCDGSKRGCLDLAKIGEVDLGLAQGVVVDVEVVGVEWERDAVRDVEGSHGVGAGDPDGGHTVANDVRNRSCNQQPDLVGVLPLNAPNAGVLVQCHNAGLAGGSGRGGHVDCGRELRVVDTLGGQSRGGRGRVGLLPMAGDVLGAALTLRVGRVGTVAQNWCTGHKLLPARLKVTQWVLRSNSSRSSVQDDGLQGSRGTHGGSGTVGSSTVGSLLILGQNGVVSILVTKERQLLLSRNVSADKHHNQTEIRAESCT